LRTEGYLTAGNYQDADLVIVNTCGFIDSAVEESLDAIGERDRGGAQRGVEILPAYEVGAAAAADGNDSRHGSTRAQAR